MDLNEEAQLKARIMARREEITARWEKELRQVPRFIGIVVVVFMLFIAGITALVQSLIVTIGLILMGAMVVPALVKATREDRRLFQEWLDNPEPTDPRIWQIAAKNLYLIDTPQKERTKHANTLMLLIAIPIFGMVIGGLAAISVVNGFWPDAPPLIRSLAAPVGLVGGMLIGRFIQQRIAARLSEE